jgi:hypothetical protein
MRGGTYDLATDLALEGAGLAGRRQPNSQAALVVQGAGLLSAATSCARAGDRSSAMKLLESADRRASDLGGDHVGSVVFGPTNVAIHRIAFEVELGDPAAALQHSTRFNIQDRPGFNERQARLLLDVARAQTELRQRSEALATMRHAESIAAEEVRTHRHSRAVLHDLQRSADAMPSTDLLQLAQRCDALVGA